MFNKTVADIVAPLTKIAENLRKHVTSQMREIHDHSVKVSELDDKISVCEREVTAAENLAKKLEKLLSVDDDGNADDSK